MAGLLSFSAMIVSRLCDNLDGTIARRYQMCSPIGAAYDVFADAVLSVLWITQLYFSTVVWSTLQWPVPIALVFIVPVLFAGYKEQALSSIRLWQVKHRTSLWQRAT